MLLGLRYREGAWHFQQQAGCVIASPAASLLPHWRSALTTGCARLVPAGLAFPSALARCWALKLWWSRSAALLVAPAPAGPPWMAIAWWDTSPGLTWLAASA
jgi:hypothetical protein